MKLFVVTAYPDGETYAYVAEGKAAIDIVMRSAEERKCRFLGQKDLDIECWLQRYGVDLIVFLPMDAEANEYLTRDKNVLVPEALREKTLEAFYPDFEAWGRARALVPVPGRRA